MMEYDEAAKVWHLMVKTHGGTVSLLQNLDAPTARQAYRGLMPREHPVEYINTEDLTSWSCGESYTLSSGTIDRVTIMGPEGAKLEPWRGVKPYVVDVGARESAREDMRRLLNANRAKPSE